MPQQTARKLTYLQFGCALMIVGLHTAFASYFRGAPDWAVWLNTYARDLFDSAISTFFFLSAMLLYRRAEKWRYGALILSRLRTLALPYVLWNALYIAAEYARGAIAGKLPGYGVLDVLMRLFIDPANSIFWFLRTLFGFVLLYPVILWCVRKKWPAWVAFAASLMLSSLPSVGVPYTSVVHWLPMYLMGAYLACHHRERLERVPFLPRRWLYPVAALALLALAWLRSLGYWAHYLYWLPAPLILWALADGAAKLPSPPWWIGASFYLFCSHLLVERYAVRLYLGVLGNGTASFLLGNLMLPALCATIALLAGALIRTLAPRLFALFTGDRAAKAVGKGKPRKCAPPPATETLQT